MQKLHVLFNQLGLMDSKVEFVYNVSGGRATSTKDLTMDEARQLIEHLAKFDGNDKMRKKVFALAYEAGIIWGDTPDDKKMNAAKLDKFLKERGAVKKSLNSLTKEELIKVVNQFSQVKKHTDDSKAGKMVKNLMNELKIPTNVKSNVATGK